MTEKEKGNIHVHNMHVPPLLSYANINIYIYIHPAKFELPSNSGIYR